jgi:tetratricopeptide (TPR) repeat protein
MLQIKIYAYFHFMKRFVFFGFILLRSAGFAQNEVIDSLLTTLKTAKEDTDKVILLNELSWNFLSVDSKKALDYSKAASNLSLDLNYTRGIYTAKKYEAQALGNLGNFAKSKQLLLELIEQQQRAGNTAELGKLYNNIARAENSRGNFDAGFNYLIKALKCFDEINDMHTKLIVYVNIGINYTKRDDHKRALVFYEKALALALQSKEDHFRLGNIYENIGTCLIVLKKYDEGLYHYSLAATNYKEYDNTYGLAGLYSNYAFYYIDVNDNANARLYIRKSIELYGEASQPSDIVTCLASLAATYFNEAEHLKPKQAAQSLDSCLFFLDSALRISKRHELTLEMFLYKRKSEVLAKTGHFESSLLALQNYESIHDSIMTLEKEKQIGELNTIYEVDLKDKENLVLSTRNDSQKQIIFWLAAFFILLIIISILIIRQNRSRARERTMAMEQKLLRSQMNPHFIFNSLQAIQNFILKNDRKEAVSYLNSFAHITRSVLENSRIETISLKKEIVLLENYLHLQKLRFGNRFDYLITVDPEMDQDYIQLPPMLAQPFIENALEHGMKDIESGGLISITVAMQDDVLLLEIKDNGKGIDTVATAKKQYASLATEITKERIALMNKTKAKKIGFTITEAYPSEVRKGVKVSFRIPL